MEILNLALNTIPLSTKYVGDSDLFFKGVQQYTEEGYNVIKENYLNQTVDNKINNYSALYLSKKQKLDNIIGIREIDVPKHAETFNTTLKDNNFNYFLTMSSVTTTVSSIPYYYTYKNTKYIEETDRMFEITLLDSINARIGHKSKNRTKYFLNYDVITNKLQFLTSGDTFNYILDKHQNKLSLFKNNKLICLNGGILSAIDTYQNFNNLHFDVNYYIQNLSPKINTSWVSYNEKNKNKYEILPFKSRSELENNYLITTQYTYVTGDTLDANILTLKNQKTNKNYSYKSNFLENVNENVPNVDNREYFGLFTGNNQEKGDYGITLSYEFYNTDYKFKTDRYTTFYTPESLYPYKQININDINWKYVGALAGENPYLSDRIFQKIVSKGNTTEQYLCSWLHKDRNGNSTWLDRYYYPEKVSYTTALQTSFNYSNPDKLNLLLNSKLLSSEYYDVPDIYNSLSEEFDHTPQTDKSVLYGIDFFDKRSDLTILPDSEYVYYRIGNNYVDEIVKTLEEFIINDGLNMKNANEATIYVGDGAIDDVEYSLNGNSYANIGLYENINTTHQFTMSFWLKSDDWGSPFGHQIVGNLSNKGFALLNDRKITPFILIQAGNVLHSYNTNYELIDISSLENEFITNSKIKDIYRTDHLDSYYTINTIENNFTRID